jgi:hypothetical protein
MRQPNKKEKKDDFPIFLSLLHTREKEESDDDDDGKMCFEFRLNVSCG